MQVAKAHAENRDTSLEISYQMVVDDDSESGDVKGHGYNSEVRKILPKDAGCLCRGLTASLNYAKGSVNNSNITLKPR